MSKHTTFSQSTGISRRSVLQFGLAALVTGIAARMLLRPGVAHAAPAGTPLIAYYSRTGNTRTVAEHIRSRVGGEMFEIRAAHAYPDDYRATTEMARQELDTNARPALAAQLASLDGHQLVFIGYPCWWGTLPMACFTFLESHAFAGKTLVPFCTHEGSGLARGPADIARLCPGATVREGLSIRGGRAASAQRNVDSWLKNLGLA